MNQIGQKNSGDLLPQMKELFAQDIHKFVNGKLVAKSIEELFLQISAARDGVDGVGTWNVREASEPIVSPEKNMVIAHFEIPTERKGTIVVMKKLICNEQGLIKEINEVFNFKTS